MFSPFAPSRRAFGPQRNRFTPYNYRKESGVQIIPQEPVSLPAIPSNFGSTILSVSSKIAAREGILFKRSPMYMKLKPTPPPGMGNPQQGSKGPNPDKALTKEDLEKHVEKLKEDEKKEKEKRKRKKDPTPKEIREHLQDIIYYRDKNMEKQYPSIYPLLGPLAGEDSDNDQKASSSDDERHRTKKRRKRSKTPRPQKYKPK